MSSPVAPASVTRRAPATSDEQSTQRAFEPEPFDSVEPGPEALLPFLVCARNPALSDPDLALPELRARLRYDLPAVSPHERDVLAMHLAAGHAVDPLAAVITGRLSERRLAGLRSALRTQSWHLTRLGGRQFAAPRPHVQLAMRWQLQKTAAGRPLRLPKPLGRLLSRVEAQANQLITWRFRHHLRLSPPCTGAGYPSIVLAGVHTEVLPVLTPAAARQLQGRGLRPAQLGGWLRHTVIDWNKARALLESDLKSAGIKPSVQQWAHHGVYQGVPFDGRVLLITL
jgi:hypothetical protein